MKFLNDLLGFAELAGPLPMSAKLGQSIYQGARMKRNVPCAILMVFLVSGLLGSGEMRADEATDDVNQMQATIKAQAFEIKQLKREQARLQVNVDQGWAIVRTQEKEADELKKRVANLEKELRDCRGINR